MKLSSESTVVAFITNQRRQGLGLARECYRVGSVRSRLPCLGENGRQEALLFLGHARREFQHKDHLNVTWPNAESYP